MERPHVLPSEQPIAPTGQYQDNSGNRTEEDHQIRPLDRKVKKRLWWTMGIFVGVPIILTIILEGMGLDSTMAAISVMVGMLLALFFGFSMLLHAIFYRASLKTTRFSMFVRKVYSFLKSAGL